MSIIHFDTSSSARPVIIMLENVTASATKAGSAASSGISVRTIGDVRREINGAYSTAFDWIDPKNLAPGDWEMSRGASAPYDLNEQIALGVYFGPLQDVWTKISTGGVYWSWQTTGISSYTATFPVYIRLNTGTPGPIIDTATWTISITQTAASSGGGGGCFTGNMRVLMADGTEKPIADILVGEVVMSYNAQTGELVESRVNDVMTPRICDIYEIHLSNGKIIETTIEHPFRAVNGQWLAIDPLATYESRYGNTFRTPANGQLKVGQLLLGAGSNASVTKIVQTGRKETVYHLAHVGMHNFYVEGINVHNIIQEEIK